MRLKPDSLDRTDDDIARTCILTFLIFFVERLVMAIYLLLLVCYKMFQLVVGVRGGLTFFLCLSSFIDGGERGRERERCILTDAG